METAIFALREISTSPALARAHSMAGGRWIRQFVAHLHDGFLRVAMGVEPIAEPGTPIQMHLSVSWCESLMGSIGPRLPTDAECHEVRHQLRHFVNWYGEFEEETRPKKSPVRQFWNPKFE
jgi:hypothetical protein